MSALSSFETKFSTAYVWIAVLIFASANSIVLILFGIGAENLIDGRNPISFCNVLFAGNVCACVAMIVAYRKDWTQENLKKLTKWDWTSLVFLAMVTGAFVPTLIFFALIYSSVTNTILVGRIEPLILLALSLVFLREKLDFWTTAGAVVSFIGVIITFVINSDGTGLNLGRGDVLAACAAALTAVSTVIAKVRLKNIPLGIFSVVRTGLGAFVFFWATVYLLDFEHFIDLTSPFLWKWMLLYGGLIVVGGQYFWFVGIRNAKTSDVSIASSFTPIAGVFFAFILLGEVPNFGVIVGGMVIILGIAIGQFGKHLSSLKEKLAPITGLSAKTLLEKERELPFKGV